MKKSTIKISLYAFFSYLKVPLVGQLFGSEIISLLFFPYFSVKQLYKNNSLLVQVSYAYLLLLLSFVISDLIFNNTSMDNLLRGWSSIIFSFISVGFLTYQLMKDEKNVYYYLFFAAISFFIFNRDLDPALLKTGQTNIFKIYFMFGVNYLVFLVGALIYKKNNKAPLLLFLAYGIACLLLDSRSNGAIFFISVMILSIKVFNIKFNKLKIIAMSVVFIAILSLSYIFYVNSVLDGTITGDNTQQLRKLENPYNPISLLEIGRVEVFVSIEAISTNPIIGYGSWAEDESGKYVRLMQAMRESSEMASENIIPVHSIVLTAWLWAGVLGLISIIALFFLVFKKVWLIFQNSESSFIVILLPLALEQFWHFLFSPFGLMRTTIPLFFALTIVEYQRLKQRNG